MISNFKKNNIYNLTILIEKQMALFSKMDEKIYMIKPAPDRWSKKEILGHLVDSAQNNIQRFIRGQYEKDSSIAYDQDKWVEFNKYQDTDLTDLIELWKLLNIRIIEIIKAMPPKNLTNTSRIKGEEFTLEWLIEDYIRHLQHHLTQINS